MQPRTTKYLLVISSLISIAAISVIAIPDINPVPQAMWGIVLLVSIYSFVSNGVRLWQGRRQKNDNDAVPTEDETVDT